ncbi:MAG: 8-oxo-dGTP diphosphatase [Spirochaetales bacterium]|nr:8-oxo-dGTP diphosphatase [Spirochaetales bacterium]
MSSSYNENDINSLNWEEWIPTEEATLCFIRKEGRLLLINKKTGMGAGLVNAPGGRIEKGETPKEGAIRETEEEVLVTPTGLEKRAELFFQFTDGYKLKAHVFEAGDYSGEPGSTREADPFWVDEEKIPYDRMWKDDRFWIPFMLQGIFVKGYFIFRDEEMLAFRLEG